MPIRTRYEHFEFPKNLDLPVHKELPEDFEKRELFLGPAIAWLKLSIRERSDRVTFMYHCRHCEGWIPGEPYEHEINNLDSSRLCGRRGTEYYCRRCAEQIYFSGMMS
jgi:hypothetical protein